MPTRIQPPPVRIPGSVAGDLAGFRRWVYSGQFPERGRLSHLAGELWVDISRESSIHNQIKTRVGSTLCKLTDVGPTGVYSFSGMLVTNVDAGFSTEPDGSFFSRETLRRGRIRREFGDDSLELVGTPDMVLEVVSPTSVEKDTVVLRDLYWKADIAEYWLIDSRADGSRIQILQHGPAKYAAVRSRDGWVRSRVFSREFRLIRKKVGPGLSEVGLEVR